MSRGRQRSLPKILKPSDLLLAKSKVLIPRQPVNWFKPRDYQKLIYIAHQECRFVLVIMPRRGGKDATCVDIIVQDMITTPGNYYYCYPRFNMGRRGLWNCIMTNGKPYMSLFPEERIIRKDSNKMFIEMRNDHGTISTFEILGMDDPERIPSLNAQGLVMSEFKKFKPKAFQLFTPIFNNNPKCWCIINSTPYGRNNHLWNFKEAALKHSDYFYIYLTLDDTKHIPVELIERDIEAGIISRDLARQEYWCDWDMGVDGTYYAKLIQEMEDNEQITDVMYDPRYPVHTAADIGKMVTILIYFQLIPQNKLHIINCTRIINQSINEAANDIHRKNYTYGTHFWPHDMKVKDWSSKNNRITIAKSLGIWGKIIGKDIGKEDGVECVRQTLPRTYIDQNHCKELVNALRNHRHEFNATLGTYTKEPVSDWTCDWADCMRYVAIATSELENKKSGDHLENIEKAMREAYLERNRYR